eukprot:8205418-Pyramimonas_sp.AAC.1
MVAAFAINSTGIQEMLESMAEWTPNSTKASFAGNSTAKRSKRTVPGRARRNSLAGVTLENSRLLAELIPSNIKAS